MRKITTDHPVTQDRSTMTRHIADFWDKTSEGWQTIWGPHIHHGYFEADHETPVEAQENLIKKLLALLEISPHHEILDVGCGLGGSSLYLAKNYGARVTGITLSPKQVEMASCAAKEKRVKNAYFKVEDALSLASFPDKTFDLVWSLESCEQFYDKPLFIKQAFRVLKPGGRLLLATWCSGAEVYSGLQARQYRKLCMSLQLPYMPTLPRYVTLLEQEGFVTEQALDWSMKVERTWEAGLASLQAYSLFNIYKMTGWRGLLFAKDARLMRDAFLEGRVKYGVFLVNKPSSGMRFRRSP